MGHGFCGGCAAALTGQFDDAAHGEGHFIADWIEMLREARDKIRAEHGEDFRAMELEGVRSASPICAPSPGCASARRTAA